MSRPIISFCIPTNGVAEWVFPVLDSIMSEKEPIDCFEIIITDNGNNGDFEERMKEYTNKYDNIKYKKTDAYMFLNQIEAFKLANGYFIKFINHRMKFLPGALNYMLDFVKRNIIQKPIIYFSNGNLKLKQEYKNCNTFDDFVKSLSIFSSWSAGISIWKDNLEKMNFDIEFNPLFPHTDILFFDKDTNNYIVNDKKLFQEIEVDDSKKGKYDLFYAFGVEYINIIKRLLDLKYISIKTFKYIKNKNKIFLTQLYYDYVLMKKPCSYDLSTYKDVISVYYSDFIIRLGIPYIWLRCIKNKIVGS